MLQRLALSRALLHDPDLLVFDEPFSALDEEGAALLDRELAELRPNATFVVATHDPERVAGFATERLAFAMSRRLDGGSQRAEVPALPAPERVR
jgi:ABC-type multidrug transport system ATPase subunit